MTITLRDVATRATSQLLQKNHRHEAILTLDRIRNKLIEKGNEDDITSDLWDLVVVKRLNRQAAYECLLDTLPLISEIFDGDEESVLTLIADMYFYLLPTSRNSYKAKTIALDAWVLSAVAADNEVRYPLKYVYSNGKELFASNGHRIHNIKLDDCGQREYPEGFYDRRFNPVDIGQHNYSSQVQNRIHNVSKGEKFELQEFLDFSGDCETCESYFDRHLIKFWINPNTAKAKQLKITKSYLDLAVKPFLSNSPELAVTVHVPDNIMHSPLVITDGLKTAAVMLCR